MRWLLLLYPRPWRRRYGDEFLALIADLGAAPRVVLDGVLGAIDAHLHPHRPAAELPGMPAVEVPEVDPPERKVADGDSGGARMRPWPSPDESASVFD
ncbi:MAG: hypothetical protein M3R38_16165, partial [Actinomycetota bacterium]|nr:hypothetical protein [Actinomycetota bacterium]